MSDEKLRELERRWKETGSVEDEAAWLKERVRIGDLTQERLAFAAYCGIASAIGAAETLSLAVPEAPEHIAEWSYLPPTGLSREEQFMCGLAVAQEAAAEADRVAKEAEKALGLPRPDSTGRQRLLSDAEGWVQRLLAGEVGPALKRRRLSSSSAADLSAKALFQAIQKVAQVPLGNAPEVALSEALVLASEVLGEDRVKAVAGHSLLTASQS